jgi:hypothetical protein
MALTDPGPGLPPRPDYGHELDTDVDPAKVKKGAALWCVFFVAVGGLALVKTIGWLGAFGVLCLALAAFMASCHTIYEKLGHFRAAVILWNEIEQMAGGKTEQAGGLAWNKGPAPHEVCEECGKDIRDTRQSVLACFKKGCPYQRGGP